MRAFNDTLIQELIDKGVVLLNPSPYTPTAGAAPNFLAGRDPLIDQAAIQLTEISSGYERQPILFHGFRGVGKTVLLRRIEKNRI